MTKRTKEINLQTGQTIQWPKGQTTIYKQDRQYNDQKDKQSNDVKQDRQYNDQKIQTIKRSTNRTDNTMTKRTIKRRKTGQTIQ